MTVLSRELHWNGATGVRSGVIGNEKSEYTAVYLVKTDNALDQADTVLAYFRTNGPYLGAAYSYANDSNPSSFVQKLAPTRSRESAFVWSVVVSYGPPETQGEQSKPDESGQPTTDPTRWADELNISHSTIRVPVYKAKHQGGIVLIDIGKEICPQNSAGTLFTPPLEKEVKIRAVRFTKYRLLFDGFEANNYMQKVNSDEVRITKSFPNYVDKWAAHSAYIAEWGGSSELINGVAIWRITVEVLINPLTWWEEVVDRGVHAKAEPGEPDGRGGTFSLTDILAGNAPVRRLVDKFNKPLTEPVLLDGLGKPRLTLDQPNFIKYQIHDEIPMQGLPW